MKKPDNQNSDSVRWMWAKGGGIPRAKCTACGVEVVFHEQLKPEYADSLICPGCHRKVVWK